jgi:hypothetical protein
MSNDNIIQFPDRKIKDDASLRPATEWETQIWLQGHERGWNDAIDEMARRGIFPLLVFLFRNWIGR